MTNHADNPLLRVRLLLGILGLLVVVQPASAQQIGYVLDVSGDWVLNGNTRLHKSSSVFAGGIIRSAATNDTSAYITIADRAGAIIATRDCGNRNGCGSRIELSTPPQRSVVGTIVDIVMQLWREDPPKYVTPMGKGDIELREAVVRLDNSAIDLRQVFELNDAGLYTVKLQPLYKSTTTRPRTPLGPVSFQWRPQNPERLHVNNLTSGLYRISLLVKQGQRFYETGADAWIIVSRDDTLRTSFDSALKLTNGWGDQVKPNTVRSFLRAYLTVLARQQR